MTTDPAGAAAPANTTANMTPSGNVTSTHTTNSQYVSSTNVVQQASSHTVSPSVQNSSSASAASGSVLPQQNLNQIVLEYLSKKGYSKTEASLRRESMMIESETKPNTRRIDELGGERYERAFNLLQSWTNDSLDLYKSELQRLRWPIFVYSLLRLALDFYPKQCETFFSRFQDVFAYDHADELRQLALIKLPEHVETNQLSREYMHNKYRLTLSSVSWHTLVQFLEFKERDGGSVVLFLIQSHLDLRVVDRSNLLAQRGLSGVQSNLLTRSEDNDVPMEDEGFASRSKGADQLQTDAANPLPKLALGQVPLDADTIDDIRAQLEKDDAKNPPAPGQDSLIDVLEARIKARATTGEAPSREQVPLPPLMARDVAMEVQKIRELRDRFKIDGVSNSIGVGIGISVCMYTFHNAYDCICCIEFSGDYKLVAIGTDDSYIRVWSLDGKPLPSILSKHSEEDNDKSSKPVSSRRLIGHSGPVYSLSFSPSTEMPNPDGPSTGPRLLLSCSADGTIRMWSLDAWECLAVYKSHAGPVWDVQWGPFGHYFASCSHDRTARLWSCDRIEPLRLFVGHDNDVDKICFHPNNAYIFTSSADRTARMWDINRGQSVRLFTGLRGVVTSLACAPNGRTLAAGDNTGIITLWDLESGRRIKTLHGHGKGGIWCLSWSVESTVIVSGGADKSVRVWDCSLPTNSNGTSNTGGIRSTVTDGLTVSSTGESIIMGNLGTAHKNGNENKRGGTCTSTIGQGTGSGYSEVRVSASELSSGVTASTTSTETLSRDLLHLFPTKQSPVYRVMFTNTNLVLAGSAFMP